MNHWQRQALSDRIHKRERYAPSSSEGHQPLGIPDPALVSPRPTAQPVKQVKRPRLPSRKKIVWPDKEELAKMLWEQPTTKIAAVLGVSDTAVKKHCEQLGLTKPPRGYWAKKNSGRVPPK